MRKATCFVVAACLLLGGSSALLADARQPHRFMPNRDTDLAQVRNETDGRSWAAWTYRNGAETDIAIASLEPSGLWTEPLLIGLDDGEDQADPALIVDANGTVYVAYTETGSGRLMLTARRIGDATWSRPLAVAQSERGVHDPTLLVVAERRLVIGYLDGNEIKLVEQRLLRPRSQVQMNDGPDPVGNSATDEGKPEDPKSEDENEETGDAEDLFYSGHKSGRGKS